MKQWHLYTPEGVQDILSEACRQKRRAEAAIRRTFELNGYDELETPSIEFYDVFSGERDLLKQESMYKFCDAKGRLLVLRPDMTVPVARLAATRIKEENWPLKLSYLGNAFSFNEVGGGKQNEYTQAGVELLGVNSPEADAEVVAMAVKALLACGIKEFQIDIGQVEFFRGIMEESGLSQAEIEEVRELIDLKDFVGVEQVMNGHSVKEELKKLILHMPRLFGSKEILKEIDRAPIGKKAVQALENIESVLDILEDIGFSQYVSVDLGMVQSMTYYTGIVFRGYTYGVGFPIISGGRYDGLVSKFGRDCPATGFSMGVNLMMMALDRQGLLEAEAAGGCLIIYEQGARRMAHEVCQGLLDKGLRAEMDVLSRNVDEAAVYARSKGIEKLITVLRDGSQKLSLVCENMEKRGLKL